MPTLSNDELKDLIQEMVNVAGSQRAVALELGISEVYLSDILNGRRDVSDNVARKLGYKKEIVYAPTN
jgi:DNA-binding transcriptional regulator YdaS (Cro superfamily)